MVISSSGDPEAAELPPFLPMIPVIASTIAVIVTEKAVSTDGIMCVFMSIHHEGFICLKQLECQGTDQRCFFSLQVLSSLLYNVALSLSNYSNYPLYHVHKQEAGKATT